MRAIALAIFLTAQATASAQAHDAVTDGGPFVNGLLHPLFEPPQILSLLALSLWVGRQTLDSLRTGVIALAAGLALALMLPVMLVPPTISTAGAVLAGALAAAAWRAPPIAVGTLACAGGVLVGLDSAADDWMFALGIWVGALLLALNVVNLAMRADRQWQRIAIRIAGAWIAAIALMLLALALRPAA